MSDSNVIENAELITQLLSEAKRCLKDNDFEMAKTKFNELLAKDSDNVEARFGLLNVSTRTSSMDELLNYYEDLYSSVSYENIKALEPDKQRIEKNVEKFYIPGYLEKEEIRSLCEYSNFEYRSCLKQRQKQRQQIEDEINNNEQLSWLYKHNDDISKGFFDRLIDTYDKRIEESEKEDRKNSVFISSEYKKYLINRYHDISYIYSERLKVRDREYLDITNALSDNLSLEEYKEYYTKLNVIIDYKDARKFASYCRKKIEELENKYKWHPQIRNNDETYNSGKKYLKSKEFDLAKTKFNELLAKDSDNVEARFGLLNVSTRTSSMDELLNYYEDLYSSVSYENIKALEPDKQRIEKNVEKFYIPGYLEKEEIRSLCEYSNFEYRSCLKQRQKQRQQIEDEINNNEQLSWLYKHNDDTSKGFFNTLLTVYDRRIDEAQEDDDDRYYQAVEAYGLFMDSVEKQLRSLYHKRLDNKDIEKQYLKSVDKFHDEYLSIDDLEKLAQEFAQYKDYEDSAYYIEECYKRIEDIGNSKKTDLQVTDALVKRADRSLKENKFDEAIKQYKKILRKDSDNVAAKLGLYMAENSFFDDRELFDFFKNKYNYNEQETVNVSGIDNRHVSRMISKYAVEGFLEEDAIRELYDYDLSYESNYDSRLKQLDEILDEIETNEVFDWLRECREEETLKNIEDLISVYEKRVELERREKNRQEKRILNNYKRFIRKTDDEVVDMYEDALQKKKKSVLSGNKIERKETVKEEEFDDFDEYDEDYDDLDDQDLEEDVIEEIEEPEAVQEEESKEDKEINISETDVTVDELDEVLDDQNDIEPVSETEDVFDEQEQEIEDEQKYFVKTEELAKVLEEEPVEEETDVKETETEEPEPIQETEVEVVDIEANNKPVVVDYKDEKYVNKKVPIFVIVASIMLLAILGTVGYYYVFVPMREYNTAVEYLNNKQYDEAADRFRELNNYRDSKSMVSEAIYRKADDLYNNKQYIEAANIFKQIDYNDSQTRVRNIKNQLINDAQVGSSIIFGMYEQDADDTNGREFIEWIVIAMEDERMLVMSKYGLDAQKYNSTSDVTSWETSSIRGWLNGRFPGNAFNGEDPSLVLSTELNNIRYNEDNEEEEYQTTDRLFLLSTEELDQYLPNGKYCACLPSEAVKKQGVDVNNGYCRWWLRDINQDDTAQAANVWGEEGQIAYSDQSISQAVRPVMWMARTE